MTDNLKKDVIQNFCVTNKIDYITDMPMKQNTSFKIGGTADFVVYPSSIEKMSLLVKYLFDNEIDYIVLGNCSNILVSDDGIKRLIIKTDKLHKISVEKTILTCQSGVLMSKAANTALSEALTGMEFAHGIPGSIGGGVCMNAGAYDHDLSEIVTDSIYVNKKGDIININNSQHDFNYRKSLFTQNNDYIICQTTFQLQQTDREQIQQKMFELMQKRRNSQPLEFPSAGSVFKRPNGCFVGKMIDECGLKGYKIGDAQISEKHSGFIINTGNASAQDVRLLIEFIKQKVYENYNIMLETEIKII